MVIIIQQDKKWNCITIIMNHDSMKSKDEIMKSNQKLNCVWLNGIFYGISL